MVTAARCRRKTIRPRSPRISRPRQLPRRPIAHESSVRDLVTTARDHRLKRIGYAYGRAVRKEAGVRPQRRTSIGEPRDEAQGALSIDEKVQAQRGAAASTEGGQPRCRGSRVAMQQISAGIFGGDPQANRGGPTAPTRGCQMNPPDAHRADDGGMERRWRTDADWSATRIFTRKLSGRPGNVLT